jgi:hypothetical protein
MLVAKAAVGRITVVFTAEVLGSPIPEASISTINKRSYQDLALCGVAEKCVKLLPSSTLPL